MSKHSIHVWAATNQPYPPTTHSPQTGEALLRGSSIFVPGPFPQARPGGGGGGGGRNGAMSGPYHQMAAAGYGEQARGVSGSLSSSYPRPRSVSSFPSPLLCLPLSSLLPLLLPPPLHLPPSLLSFLLPCVPLLSSPLFLFMRGAPLLSSSLLTLSSSILCSPSPLPFSPHPDRVTPLLSSSVCVLFLSCLPPLLLLPSSSVSVVLLPPSP